MRELATGPWAGRDIGDRISWCVQTCNEYWFDRLEKLILKDLRRHNHDMATLVQPSLLPTSQFAVTEMVDRLRSGVWRLLDVGSCYNPFLAWPQFVVTAIDIAPASEVFSVTEYKFATIQSVLLEPNYGHHTLMDSNTRHCSIYRHKTTRKARYTLQVKSQVLFCCQEAPWTYVCANFPNGKCAHVYVALRIWDCKFTENHCVVHSHVCLQTFTVLAVVSEGSGNAFVMLFLCLMAVPVKRLSDGFTTGLLTKQQLNPVQLVFFSYLDWLLRINRSRFIIVALTLSVRWCS